MPQYEYACANGHTVDIVRTIHKRDWPLEWCRECAAAGVQEVSLARVSAAPGFSIKGYNAQNGYAAPQCGSGGCER